MDTANPPTPASTAIDSKLDAFLQTLKVHNKYLDVCFNDAVVVTYLKFLIAQEANKARLDELKKLWGHAREHTITDIEMIMHHSGGKVDFIEAVSTDIFEKRYQELTPDKEKADG